MPCPWLVLPEGMLGCSVLVFVVVAGRASVKVLLFWQCLCLSLSVKVLLCWQCLCLSLSVKVLVFWQCLCFSLSVKVLLSWQCLRLCFPLGDRCSCLGKERLASKRAAANECCEAANHACSAYMLLRAEPCNAQTGAEIDGTSIRHAYSVHVTHYHTHACI